MTSSIYRVSQKNSSGHFRSYLTIAIEFFDTLNMKIITDKFLINFKKNGRAAQPQ